MLSQSIGNVKPKLDNSVIIGVASIRKIKILCMQLDKTCRMGTIGVAEGEKVTLAFEYATKKKLPIVAVVSSGGIRVNEGTLALMQMAKMAAAVKQHSAKGLPYISVVTTPTLGGASASFVSLADIIIAEKDAIYGFSGRRIIEDTTHEQLPEDFWSTTGIWSIFTICAALFDAPEESVIVIDEPELSVHPALQKRLMTLFLEYSMTRQIIVCTHSPYFVNWEAIVNGANLIRVVKECAVSKCYMISNECRSSFGGILRDLNNPHTLGIEANEAFFLEDSIILVEGQEDVVIFNKITKKLNLTLKGNFFGWGVGGASKMKAFLILFKDLGYKKLLQFLTVIKRMMLRNYK